MGRSPHSAEMVDRVVENLEPYFRLAITWLILPIMLWLCTTIFLLAITQLTKQHRVPVWKSSPLILARLQAARHQPGF
ncbi:hypothetical protein BKA66DRAFT_185338 [Pyrenochaeta sp. MPI-SDFR-AT-0127]|nr:hypothetical protein BKA66DRAFT_185338 [Pyrenochaeta sp. MPI-SDFR-AT-0127]